MSSNRVFTPENHGIGIVHIGPGAFHRAHQAVFTQDAMAEAGGDWRIEGVSLRSTGVADALNAQDGQYTLVSRGQSGTQYRRIASIARVLAGARGIELIEQALDRAETRIVSLTVTEKAYAQPDNTKDHQPNVIALVTEALGRRRVAGLEPFTLMSCDNLTDNGSVLRREVLQYAGQSDPELAKWIEANCAFPSTMVDRITPATTPDLIREVKDQTGWADQVPVETEVFRQWVVEDKFANERPQWERAGVLMVSDVAPYEHMKLRMLNGAHSMLAYAGHLSGKKYVRDVMADPALAQLVDRHMSAAAATLDLPEGFDVVAYRKDLLARFANPHIAHETYQIAMDGSQKMMQRIFEPALEAIQRQQDVSAFTFAIAAWLQYGKGQTDAGLQYALRDPRAHEIEALPSDSNQRVEALCKLPNLVPAQLAAHAAFKEALVAPASVHFQQQYGYGNPGGITCLIVLSNLL